MESSNTDAAMREDGAHVLVAPAKDQVSVNSALESDLSAGAAGAKDTSQARNGEGAVREEGSELAAASPLSAISRAGSATVVPLDEDPNSEVNFLRRELRRLQMAVRNATLQSAVQQEELLDLREEIESVYAREAVLLSHLVTERRRVRATMAAAESLVRNLREMEMDEVRAQTRARPSPRRPSVMQARRPRVGLDTYAVGQGHQGRYSRDGRFETYDDEREFDDDEFGAMENENFTEHDGEYGREFQEYNDGVDNEVCDERDEEPLYAPYRVAAAPRRPDVDDTPPAVAGTREMEMRFNLPKAREVSHEARDIQGPQSFSVFSASRNVEASGRAQGNSPSTHGARPRMEKRKARALSQPAASAAASLAPANSRSPSSVGASSSRSSVTATPMMVAAFKPSSPVSSETPRSPQTRQTPPPMSLVSDACSKRQSIPSTRAASAPDGLPSAFSFAVSDAHDGEIYALASTPDGGIVASGGDDKIVRLYNTTLRKTSTTLLQCTKSVTALAFDVTGTIISAGMYDGTFRLWRKDTSRKRVKWAHGSVQPCHSSAVRRIIFDPHSTAAEPRLYTASVDRSIKLTDTAAGKMPFVAYTPSAVLDMDVQGGSGIILSGHKDGALRMWSAKDGKNPVGLGVNAHSRAITSVSCLEDGFGVVTLGRDNVLKLSDTRVSLDDTVREMEAGVKTGSDWHRAALCGRHVAAGLDDSGGTVAIWNVDSGKIVRKLGPQGGTGESDVFRLLTGGPGCPLVPLWCPLGLVAASATKQITYWS